MESQIESTNYSYRMVHEDDFSGIRMLSRREGFASGGLDGPAMGRLHEALSAGADGLQQPARPSSGVCFRWGCAWPVLLFERALADAANEHFSFFSAQEELLAEGEAEAEEPGLAEVCSRVGRLPWSMLAVDALWNLEASARARGQQQRGERCVPCWWRNWARSMLG